MSNTPERSESAAETHSADLEQGFLAKIESVSYTHLTLPTSDLV